MEQKDEPEMGETKKKVAGGRFLDIHYFYARRGLIRIGILGMYFATLNIVCAGMDVCWDGDAGHGAPDFRATGVGGGRTARRWWRRWREDGGVDAGVRMGGLFISSWRFRGEEPEVVWEPWGLVAAPVPPESHPSVNASQFQRAHVSHRGGWLDAWCTGVCLSQGGAGSLAALVLAGPADDPISSQKPTMVPQAYLCPAGGIKFWKMGSGPRSARMN